MTGRGRNFAVPSEDLARDAMHAIRGYIYQVYTTARHWSALGPREVLHLECGGDFVKVAAGALSGHEVKNAARTVTLRSDDVTILLDRFWRLRAANADRAVSMSFLTTSGMGVERGLPTLKGEPALAYWRRAAAGNADPAPLREALLGLPLNEPLKDWLGRCSDEELTRDLLRQIRFECGAPELPDLKALLVSDLVDSGSVLHLGPSDAAKSLPAVVLHLLHVAAGPEPRTVTRDDLLELLQLHGTSPIAHSILEAVQRGLAPSASSFTGLDIGLPVETVPVDHLAVAREDLVARLDDQQRRGEPLWLMGPSGLGKTSLAVQVARRRNGAWTLVEFAGLKSVEVANRLQGALALTRPADFGGLILDDLPNGLDRSAAGALSRLVLAIDLAGGALIVTSYHPPAPTLAALLKISGGPIEVPYFTRDEVAAFISREGGDAETWAGVIHLSAGAGFPQRVAARIRGLKTRGWPQSEIADGVLPGSASVDLEAERVDVMARLRRDVPDPAVRTMLFRLAVPGLGFDRRLALAIGGVAPAISAPGDAFDALVGPWIERRGQDRFRASPLVAEAGAKALAEEELGAVHVMVSGNLAGRRPIEVRWLNQLFLSAFISKDPVGLTTVAMVVLRAEHAAQRALAERQLVGLRWARFDQPLLSEVPDVTRLLRLAQLVLCVRGGDGERALKVFDRCMIEIGGAAEAAEMQLAAITTLLSSTDIVVPVEVWLPLVRKLHELSPPDLKSAEHGLTQAQAIFAWRAAQLESVSQLETLFGVLDTFDAEERALFLASLAEPFADARTVVQSPWADESEREGFDAASVAQRYARLQGLAEAWGAVDLALECACSRVALLFEYTPDAVAALQSLDAAKASFGPDARLEREHAKILMAQGRYAESAAVLAPIATAGAAVQSVDRVYVFRDLAISLAKSNQAAAAALRFREAGDAAGAHPQTAARGATLHVEEALLRFGLGEDQAAAEALARAADLSDLADPDVPSQQYRLRMVRGVLAWAANRHVETLSPPGPGLVSMDARDFDWSEPPVRPLAIRYLMAAFERATGLDVGARAALAARTAHQHLEFYAGPELHAQLYEAAEAGQIEMFVSLLSHYCRWGEKRQAQEDDLVASQTLLLAEPSWSGLVLDLDHPAQGYYGRAAIGAWLVLSVLQGRDDLSELARRLRDEPSLSPLADLLTPPEATASSLVNGEVTAALAVICGDDPFPDPALLFLATYRAWELLSASTFEDKIGPPLGEAIATLWCRRLRQGGFALRNPARNGPPIEAALNRLHSGRDLARLLLAAEPAVQFTLDTERRAGLTAAAQR